MVVLITGSIYIAHLKHKHDERTTIHLLKTFWGTFSTLGNGLGAESWKNSCSHSNQMTCDSRKYFYPDKY